MGFARTSFIGEQRRSGALNWGRMESLWSRIEPLLSQVTKPARYIGGELGAQSPEHVGGTVAWLLVYPDTYEIGLPNQGLQILYEILNERPDAVAERSYAPWVDMEEQMRANRIPFFCSESHLPARAFDVLAFNLSAELTYTNLLNLIDLSAACRCAAPNAAPGTRWWSPGATAPSTPSRWPISSTPSSSGTARR